MLDHFDPLFHPLAESTGHKAMGSMINTLGTYFKAKEVNYFKNFKFYEFCYLEKSDFLNSTNYISIVLSIIYTQ